MISITHPEYKKIAKHWKVDDINSLESLRESIINAAKEYGKKHSSREEDCKDSKCGECSKCLYKKFSGNCFEIWGEYFINYYHNHSEVGFEKDTYSPLLVVKDYGVDGYGKSIEESHPNRTVQFKFRSNPSDLATYAEIAKFRDQSREDYNVNNNKQMLFITTALGYNEEAKSQARGMPLLGWNQLKEIIGNNASFWEDFIKTYQQGIISKERQYKELKPHQKLITNKATEFLKSDQDRAYVLCGTGGGKTLAMHVIAEEYFTLGDKQLVVVATPRIQLSNQVAKEFYSQKKIDFGWLTFHSGAPAEYEEYNEEEAFIEASSLEYEEERIRALNGLSTTDLQAVTRLLKKQEQSIIFTTYHSSEKLLDHLNSLGVNFLYLADECHNLVTPSFATILHRTDIEKFMGFTATIEETSDPADDGMNNYGHWGDCLVEIKPADLVEVGFTVPPRVFYAEIETSRSDPDDIVAESTAQIIRRFKDECCSDRECRIIINCTSCSIAHYLADKSDILKKALPEFDLYVVTSYRDLMGARKRDKELAKFSQSKNAAIFHYSMLGEGIDVPGVTAIMSWRELGVRDAVQLIGRASRLVENDRVALDNKKIEIGKKEGWDKPYAYVLCPRIKGNVDSDHADSDHAYKNMLRIIGRLRNRNRTSNLKEYIHVSSGRYETPAFPKNKDYKSEKPDQLYIEIESSEDAQRIYTGRTPEEIISQIEQDLEKMEKNEAQVKRKNKYVNVKKLVRTDICLTPGQIEHYRQKKEKRQREGLTWQ